jgi:hypothetical protein
MKTCTKCGVTKALEDFHCRKSNKDGHATQCKVCTLNYIHTEEVQLQRKKWRNSDSGKATHKKWADSDAAKESWRKYRKTEKGKKATQKYDSTENATLRRLIRTRLYIAVKGRKNHPAVVKDLGCTVDYFMSVWIPAQFQTGMSWENYGDAWSIDHIIPFKDVDVKDEEQLVMVTHHYNVRPVWNWINTARNKKNDSEIDFTSSTPKFIPLELNTL